MVTPLRRQFSLHIDGELIFHRGRLNIIVGPTGSGKTSLLMAMLGLWRLWSLSADKCWPSLGEMHFIPSAPQSTFYLPRKGGVAYAAQETWVHNETIKVQLPRKPWLLANHATRTIFSLEHRSMKSGIRKVWGLAYKSRVGLDCPSLVPVRFGAWLRPVWCRRCDRSWRKWINPKVCRIYPLPCSIND